MTAALDEVDRLLAVITVDCHNLAEEVTAFYETLTEEVPLPATATAGGRSLQVVRFYIDERGYDLAARCRDDDVIHDRRLTDLVFAPDTEAGWNPRRLIAAALAWCRIRRRFRKDGNRHGPELTTVQGPCFLSADRSSASAVVDIARLQRTFV